MFNGEALRPPVTGVGNYTYHLMRELCAMADVEQVLSFTGTGWVDAQTQLAMAAASLADTSEGRGTGVDRAVAAVRKFVGLMPGAKSVYDTLMDRRFESGARTYCADLYHETNYILKPFDGRVIATVHDLSHIRHPEFHPPQVVNRLEKLLPRTFDRAEVIITDSDVVRSDLIDHYGLSEDRVRTVYLGADESYAPRSAEQTRETLSQFGLVHGHYVLLVATLEPRKGIDVLLQAWELVPEELRRGYPLVLSGASGWRNEDIRERLQRLQGEGSVKHLGYVPSEVLPPLFSGAAVFAYPSVYEGFGLPALDAMSSSVPVVCRAGTSMAEFSKGDCILCETDTVEELAEALQRLLEDPELRRHWGERGYRRAAEFSWRRCAEETYGVYRSVL